MTNLKKLSRTDLKDVFGGRKACTLMVQASNGQWYPQAGTCTFHSTGTTNGVVYGGYSFCNTGDGINHALSSNGGLSHCND